MRVTFQRYVCDDQDAIESSSLSEAEAMRDQLFAEIRERERDLEFDLVEGRDRGGFYEFVLEMPEFDGLSDSDAAAEIQSRLYDDAGVIGWFVVGDHSFSDVGR